MVEPCTCYNPCQNLFSAGENELAGAALTKSSGTPIPTSVILRATTPAPATAPAATLSLDNKQFKQFMKAYFKAQVPGQTEVDPKPR